MSIANTSLTTSESGAIVTGAANGTAIVSISFCNTDASARTVTVYAKAAVGTSAGVLNTLLSAFSINAGETYVWNDKILLGVNNVLTAKASTDNVVGMTTSYLDL